MLHKSVIEKFESKLVELGKKNTVETNKELLTNQSFCGYIKKTTEQCSILGDSKYEVENEFEEGEIKEIVIDKQFKEPAGNKSNQEVFKQKNEHIINNNHKLITQPQPHQESQTKKIKENSTTIPIEIKPDIEPKSQISHHAPKTVTGATNVYKKSEEDLPKVATLNNLLRLAETLDGKSILTEIKTKGCKEKIPPIKLLFYYCIEQVMFSIWRENGVSKMIEVLENPHSELKFLRKWILNGIVELLVKFPNLEKQLLLRVLIKVFQRLGIEQFYEEEWLSKCVKTNLKVFENTKANIKHLLSDAKSNPITSNIFVNVPLKNNDDKNQISLEDEENCKERIDDFSKPGYKEKLFFFKTSFHKKTKNQIEHKNSSKETQIEKELPKVHQKEEPIMKIKKIDKMPVVQEAEIMKKPFENKKSIDLDVNLNKGPIQPTQSEKSSIKQQTPNSIATPIVLDSNEKIVSSQKRERSEPSLTEVKQIAQNEEHQQLIVISKDELKSLIEDHFFSNINSFIDKISNKFQVSHKESQQALKESGICRNQASKKPKLNEEVMKNKLSESDLLEMLNKKYKELKMLNPRFPDEEVVEPFFKILEENKIDNEEKQNLIWKWFENKDKKNTLTYDEY